MRAKRFRPPRFFAIAAFSSRRAEIHRRTDVGKPLIQQVRLIKARLDGFELLGGILLVTDENLANIG